MLYIWLHIWYIRYIWYITISTGFYKTKVNLVINVALPAHLEEIFEILIHTKSENVRIFLLAAAGTLHRSRLTMKKRRKNCHIVWLRSLAGGESDKVNLNVNRGFLVVLVSCRKVISQLRKHPAKDKIKIRDTKKCIFLN